MTALVICFCLCWFVPVYCYLLFPLYMKWVTKKINVTQNNYSIVNQWPPVTVVFAVYNEASVIKQKLISIINSDYPTNQIKILIGSDNSTDTTHVIIEQFQKQSNNIELKVYTTRQGKLNIINDLVSLTQTEHLVLTDANVFFEPQTIKALVYNLTHKGAAMVCGNIHKYSPQNNGISNQEIAYMNFENNLKHYESLKYGFIAGVEGGCYAILKKHFIKVPEGFVMDDFFITLDVISKNYKVLFEPEALCFEDVNDLSQEEFKRKIRISIGNFRNLAFYKSILWPMYKGFGFVFFSHKVMRWMVPFAILISCIILCFIIGLNFNYSWLMLFYALAAVLALLTLKLKHIKIPIISGLGHFILMNVALFVGYIKYKFSLKQSAWQPPQRNVIK